MKQIVLYGIAGASKAYRVVGYYVLHLDEVKDIIHEVRYQATRMGNINPSVRKVYLMNNRAGLRRDYMDAYRDDSIESWVIFKDILEREGLEIIV